MMHYFSEEKEELNKKDDLFAIPGGGGFALSLRLEDFYYIFGYLFAAQVIIDQIKQGLVHPERAILQAAYLYRHHLELLIKGIINDIAKFNSNSRPPPKNHNLKDLTGALAEAAPNLKVSREFRHFSRLVDQVTKLDPRGESFRYSLRRDGSRTVRSAHRIDPANMARCFEKMSFFLERVWDSEMNLGATG